MSKRRALLVIAVLTLSSLVILEPAFAQSQTLSVPEFTAKYIDKSYDVPTSTSIDPYTGETVTNPSYHVENKVIELNIKNQKSVGCYYGINFKGHFEETWRSIFSDENSPRASASEYTTVTLICSKDQSVSSDEIYAPPGGKVDFRVKAFLGVYTRDFSSPLPFMGFEVTEESGWSITQTIAIPVNSTSGTIISSAPAADSASKATSQPFLLAVVIGAVVGGVCVALLIYFKKRKRQAELK